MGPYELVKGKKIFKNVSHIIFNSSSIVSISSILFTKIVLFSSFFSKTKITEDTY